MDGINGLSDLNNNPDLNGIAQLTESLGGIENLQQFLQQVVTQNQVQGEGEPLPEDQVEQEPPVDEQKEIDDEQQKVYNEALHFMEGLEGI